MRSIGICVGASTISRVDVEKKNNNMEILNIISKLHDGRYLVLFYCTITRHNWNKMI